MVAALDYPSGATPLDADELASLIPGHITTQGELNEWEQLNIVQGEQWARKQRKEILNEAFVRQLHKQMFGDTRRWAGSFRKSDKNIGIDWPKIPVELRKLLDDVHYQIEHASYLRVQACNDEVCLAAATLAVSIESGRGPRTEPGQNATGR